MTRTPTAPSSTQRLPRGWPIVSSSEVPIPQQRTLRRSFLSRIPQHPGTDVLEIGTGTGVVARDLAALPGVNSVVGVDPSPFFVERARGLTGEDTPVSFEVADGTALPFLDGEFTLVVLVTTLCHAIDAARVLAEARRMLAPDGTLAVLEGDYMTTTVAASDDDPLQACVQGALTSLVHDRWLVRRLQALVRQAGFRDLDLENHGYVEAEDASYIASVVDVGSDALSARGVIGEELAAALKAEARRRMSGGTFFGHIAYASLLAFPAKTR